MSAPVNNFVQSDFKYDAASKKATEKVTVQGKVFTLQSQG